MIRSVLCDYSDAYILVKGAAKDLRYLQGVSSLGV